MNEFSVTFLAEPNNFLETILLTCTLDFVYGIMEICQPTPIPRQKGVFF